jgi:phosphonate transport system substrate-binding protein
MLNKILLSAALVLAIGANAYAADMKEIRVGILGGENESDRLKNNACLADHLKADFGVDKVSLFPAADYDGVIQGLLGGTLDVAELGASGYAGVYLKDATAVTPILTTQSPDGATGYHSIGLQGQEARLRRSRFDLGLPRAADSDPRYHGHAERQVLCLNPVQWRA